MIRRISNVNNIAVNSIAFSSQVQIGDSHEIYTNSRTLAVQREKELFFGREGNFNKYSTFLKPISFPPLTEPISILFHHKHKGIHVDHVYVTAISIASLLHIGTTSRIVAENRRKNIRQLEKRNNLSSNKT